MEVCRICLVRDTQLHDIDMCGLRVAYEALTNCLLTRDGFPKKLCWECRARLQSSARFRAKALRSQALLTAARFNQCNVQQLCIDREDHNLTSSLTSKTFTDHYEVELHWGKETPCLKREWDGESASETQWGHEVKIEPALSPPRTDPGFHEAQMEEPVTHEIKAELQTDDGSSESDYKPIAEVTTEICQDLSSENLKRESVDTPSDPESSIPNSEAYNVYSVGDECKFDDESPGYLEQKRTYKCKICDYKEDRLFACVMCDYACNKKGQFQNHLMQHSGERPYKCVCGYKSIEKRKLQRHIELASPSDTQDHTPQPVQDSATPKWGTFSASTSGPFECGECGKSYDSKSELRKHILTHVLLERSLKVSQYTYRSTFASKLLLTEHMEQQHSRYTCPECDFKTVQKASLTLHRKKHAITCKLCDYKTARKDHMKQHFLRKHTQEKPYKCNQCDSGFEMLSKLRTHELLHSGEKPYKCKHCSFATRHSSSLASHQKVHNGRKIHKCTLCDYSAAKKYNLKLHIMNSHSGEKPFKCHLCSYTCCQKCTLREHMTVHTSEKAHKCEICSYACKNGSNLKKHMKKRHSCQPGASKSLTVEKRL